MGVYLISFELAKIQM